MDGYPSVFNTMAIRGVKNIAPNPPKQGVRNPIFDETLQDERSTGDEARVRTNRQKNKHIRQEEIVIDISADEPVRTATIINETECKSITPRTELPYSDPTNTRRTNGESERTPNNVADKKWLKQAEGKFRKSLDINGRVTIDEFTRTLGLKRDLFSERVFEIFDSEGKGSITIAHLMKELHSLTNNTPEQTLEFIFNIYDSEGDGKLTREGLQHVLQVCVDDSSLSLADEQLEHLTDVLFDEADGNNDGSITFDEFRQQLDRHPDVMDNLCISVSQWLKHKEPPKRGLRCPRYCTGLYIRNHAKKIVYLCLYVLANLALFITAFWAYRESNIWIQIARGCGQCLNFNCMWVFVLMLRKSMTYIRSTKLRHLLPLDQHISFHKITGYTIVFFSVVHTLAHIANAEVVANNSINSTMKTWEILFTTKAKMGHGIMTGSAFLTGWLLTIILIPMVLCSMSFIRRSGYFEIFHLVHLLYIPFWILLLMHGYQFWKWFLLPGLILIVEKVLSSKPLKKAQYGDTWIEEVNLLHSKVTHLVINRPEKFDYQPGDFIYLQIPAIAKYEWHPFTISSAPEMSGQFWLHIRSAGNWTNKLYEYFDTIGDTAQRDGAFYVDGEVANTSSFSKTFSRRSKQSVKRHSTSGLKQNAKHKQVNVQCFIDGPYGTCARELLKSEHAVLISTGIGVTPMASILQSVYYKFNQSTTQCQNCKHFVYHNNDNNNIKLNKVDFIWVNRDQKNFEWFLTLLSELELQQAYYSKVKHFIQTHLYMTSAKKRTDLKGIGLQMALDLVHEKNKRDLITGLRARTNPGRPDWDEIFRQIKAENRGKVKVYFCGPLSLGSQIKQTALKYSFEFSRETF